MEFNLYRSGMGRTVDVVREGTPSSHPRCRLAYSEGFVVVSWLPLMTAPVGDGRPGYAVPRSRSAAGWLLRGRLKRLAKRAHEHEPRPRHFAPPGPACLLIGTG